MTICTHMLKCDVLVAGGGMAGVSAAIAAARCGARVVLCQDRPVLGGNASSEIRMHIVGADQSGKRGKKLEVEAREGGLIEEIRLENAVRNPQRSPSMFDLILYEKCTELNNLTLLLNTTVVEAVVHDYRIEHVIADRQSTEDRFQIFAEVFLDCTGDGRLGLEAGAAFMEGRESKEQFDETLAQDIADKKRLGSTIMFQARKHEQPMPFIAPSRARSFKEADLHLRPHASADGHGDLNLEYGFWWVEWGGEIDTIKDNEKIRDELLAIVMGVWDHIKNSGEHGAEHWALDWFGFLPGKRESRRFVGQHILTEKDIVESVSFADAIAYGGWWIDTHPVEGVDAPDSPPCVQHEVPFLYDIPLRSCVSSTIENLMFAGRNISATHIAFASTRVMATCSVVGQGVGTAAAYAVAFDKLPSALAQDVDAMKSIQQQLLKNDAYLLGINNDDSLDLAHQATVKASSEEVGAEAVNIICGPTRSLHGTNGVPRERVAAGVHRWMSSPKDSLPVWIELSWAEPIQPKLLQLIFDTGMHNILTFSLADSYTEKMQWGRAQEETVRDYCVEAGLNEEWRVIQNVTNNWQRCNRITLDGKPLDKIRITVTATNGIDHARVCEVRVYERDLGKLNR